MSESLYAAMTDGQAGKPAHEARNHAVLVVKRALENEREAALAAFRTGETSSLDAARALAAAADRAVGLIHRHAIDHTEGEPEPGFAVLAVGGYGRGLMAPYSDLDLLFLRGGAATDWEERVIEAMLYMLWDLGLKVGHAARTVDETVSRARNDSVVMTTLLDARCLEGDAALFGSFQTRLRTDALTGRESGFVREKLAERDRRLARIGASRFMVEPDIKDGKGGLRDLNTLNWLAQTLFPEEGLAGLPVRGLLSERDVERYEAALAFLWSVRLHLHDLAGRGQETLSFDFQPELAARMGYSDALFEPAVELFMRDYFRVATDVGGLVRVACARLEALHAKPAPDGVSRGDPVHKQRDLNDDAYRVLDGRLGFADRAVVEQRPLLLLDMFREADRLGLDLHPDALAVARDSLHLIGEPLRRNAEARDIFFEILTESDSPPAVLRLMIETGVLGSYLPEFGRVVGRTQFNMYHAFTVDEHTLRAIGVIAGVERGREEGRHPLSTMILPRLKNRRALYLAMLLHDTGKAGGDQCVEGAKAARAACRRWGLDEQESALIEWLIRHHLDMSDAAQRRDLGDPKTIADFAELVGDEERLGLLLVLTVADIRAVAPGVWNDFKAELLRELYRLTSSALRDAKGAGVQASLTRRADVLRREIVADLESGAARDWAGDMEDAYWLAFDSPALRRHASFAREHWRDEAPAAQARLRSRRGAAELLVCAPDRSGLFADLAAAMAHEGADVVDARIFTTGSGRAFDVFYLQTPQGEPFGDQAPDDLARLEAAMREAAGGHPPQRPYREHRARAREAVFAIEPGVEFDDDASERSTIIEVSGRDRTGLLRDLARVLAEQGLSVASAHIETRGERAVDVFYVTDAKGEKITDANHRSLIAEALKAIIASPEDAMEHSSTRRGLRRAPASPAR